MNVDVRSVTDGAPPEAAYERLLGARIFGYQKCNSCEASVFPPRVLCVACGSTSMDWEESTGDGTVYSTTTLFPRNADPYAVALVDVDEGFRLMTRIVDTEAESVHIGMRVHVAITEVDGAPLPLFSPKDA